MVSLALIIAILVENSEGLMSENYPQNSKDYLWIMKGEKEYYFEEETLLQKYLVEKGTKTWRTKMTKEFKKRVQVLTKEPNKNLAYKAFGELLTEIEKKNLPQMKVKESFNGDLDMKVDNHFLNMVENHPDELRERLKKILISKLRKVQPRKLSQAQKQKQGAFIESNEFIGEDEIIVPLQSKSEEYTISNVITPPKIKFENIKNEGLKIQDIHSLSHGEDMQRIPIAYQTEIMQKLDEASDNLKHNNKMKTQYYKGQEGIDFTTIDYRDDVRLLMKKRLLKER